MTARRGKGQGVQGAGRKVSWTPNSSQKPGWESGVRGRVAHTPPRPGRPYSPMLGPAEFRLRCTSRPAAPSQTGQAGASIHRAPPALAPRAPPAEPAPQPRRPDAATSEETRPPQGRCERARRGGLARTPSAGPAPLCPPGARCGDVTSAPTRTRLHVNARGSCVPFQEILTPNSRSLTLNRSAVWGWQPEFSVCSRFGPDKGPVCTPVSGVSSVVLGLHRATAGGRQHRPPAGRPLPISGLLLPPKTLHMILKQELSSSQAESKKKQKTNPMCVSHQDVGCVVLLWWNRACLLFSQKLFDVHYSPPKQK